MEIPAKPPDKEQPKTLTPIVNEHDYGETEIAHAVSANRGRSYCAPSRLRRKSPIYLAKQNTEKRKVSFALNLESRNYNPDIPFVHRSVESAEPTWVQLFDGGPMSPNVRDKWDPAPEWSSFTVPTIAEKPDSLAWSKWQRKLSYKEFHLFAEAYAITKALALHLEVINEFPIG